MNVCREYAVVLNGFNVISIGLGRIFAKPSYNVVSVYFFCLIKKSNKKNQGKPDRSAHFAGPKPHIEGIKVIVF